MRLLAAALFLFTLHALAQGDIEVREAWSRATPPGAKLGVAYMEIRNRGPQAERLIAASTPVARSVEMHVTQRDGEVMKMRQVQGFDIPARERITLRPGGSHLMLVDIAKPLEKGERFRMRLRFERAGEMEIELQVQEQGSRHPGH
jgi:periplasmic copper chaperone A